MKKRLLGLNALVLALIAILAMFRWFDAIATNESGPLLTRSYTGFAAFPALGPSLITGAAAIFMMAVSKGALRRVVAVLATGVALITLRSLLDSFGSTSDRIVADFFNVIPDAFELSGEPANLFYLPSLFLAGCWALITFVLLFVSDSASTTKSYSRAKPAPEFGAWAALSVGVDPTDDDTSDNSTDSADASDASSDASGDSGDSAGGGDFGGGDFGGGLDGGAGAST